MNKASKVFFYQKLNEFPETQGLSAKMPSITVYNIEAFF